MLINTCLYKASKSEMEERKVDSILILGLYSWSIIISWALTSKVMNRQVTTTLKEARPEIPVCVMERLKKMNSKEREQLLNNLLQGGDQRLGFYHEEKNVFFQFIWQISPSPNNLYSLFLRICLSYQTLFFCFRFFINKHLKINNSQRSKLGITAVQYSYLHYHYL